jgi:hypothetical protein
MNKLFFALLVAALAGLSCKPETGSYTYSYPPVTYTNDSSWPVKVRNAADEEIQLDIGESKTLDSEPRGRADIVEIRPAYVTWRLNGGVIYDIRFVDRTEIELEIRNHSSLDIILTEGNGSMLPVSQPVPAGNKIDTGFLYTDKPFFQLLNISDLTVDYWYTDTGTQCIVGIDPPSSGDWWKVELPSP